MIDKAELEKDLTALIAQANQVTGAIQYIRQKLQQFKKPVESEVKNGDNGDIGS